MSTLRAFAPEPAVAEATARSSRDASATRVGRNTAFRVMSQGLSAVVNVAGMVLLGNHLSASGYGQYAFYYALIPLVASLADLGAGVIVTREVARTPGAAARYMGDALMLRGVVGVALLALAGIGSALTLDPANAVLVTLVTAAAVLDFGQDVSVWMLRASERLDLEAALLLVSQGAWIIGIALGVAFGATLPLLLGMAVGAFLLRTLVGAFVVSRLGLKPDFSPALARFRRLAAEGWPVALSLLVVVLYGRVGVFALKAFGSDAEVACFTVAYMLSQPFGFLGSALALAAFPAFARMGGTPAPELARPLRAAFKYQLLVSLPLAAGLLLLADRIVPLLFHDASGYAQAGTALGIMSLALPFVFFNLQSRYLLAAVGRQRVYLWAVVAGLVVNAVVCVLTVPAWGVTGASWTFVTAELLVFVVCHRTLAGQVSYAALLREAARPALAAVVMAATLFALRTAALPLAIVAGALSYGLALFLLRALSRDEWSVVRGVLLSFRLPRAAGDRRPS